jgi:hypothetical protein
MKAFRVKDLMVNLIPRRGGGGGTGMPGPDDDINTFPPTITPIISVAVFSPKVRYLVNFAGKLDELEPQYLERVVMDLGQAAFAGLLAGNNNFQCAEPEATVRLCQRNPVLSRVAHSDALRFDDLVEMKPILRDALDRITEIEKGRLIEAQRNAGEIVPKLQAAIVELQDKVVV